MRFKAEPGIDAILDGARYMLTNGADSLLGPKHPRWLNFGCESGYFPGFSRTFDDIDAGFESIIATSGFPRPFTAGRFIGGIAASPFIGPELAQSRVTRVRLVQCVSIAS